MMFLWLSAIVGGILLWFLTTSSSPRHKVYRLPGRLYWIKRAIMYVLLKKRKWQLGQKSNMFRLTTPSSPESAKSTSNPEILELPHPLKNHPFAMDSAYYAGFGQDGTNVVFRISHRSGRRAEVWLFLDLPGIGSLQHPVHPDTSVYNVDSKIYNASGLTFDMQEPMLIWNVSYCGQLRVGLCNDIGVKPDKYVHVRLSLSWHAFTGSFDFEMDNPSLLSDAIAREDWNNEFWNELQRKGQSHYEQWGELRGTVCVEGYEERRICLKTVRDHSFGVRDWNSFNRYVVHYIYVESGLVAQVGIISYDVMSHLKIGYLCYPNGDMVSVSSINLNLWDVGEDGQPPTDYHFSFVAGGQEFKVHVQGGTTPVWYNNEDRGGKVMEMFCKFTVNGKPGRGLTEYLYRNSAGEEAEAKTSFPLLTEPSEEEIGDSENLLVLPFSHVACSAACVVGGKGSQLALMSQIKQQVNVPQGICLTLAAFQQHLEIHPELTASILKINNSAVNGTLKDLQMACSDAVTLLTTTAVDSLLQTTMTSGLHSVFGSDVSKMRFAVRSSAAGEDGLEASSAGQMDTFLGVFGSTELLADAVKKCWASAFTFHAVEYRRQHGQTLDTPVGVVIQEMVPSNVSGVLFTKDPVTGDSCQMVVNANYGLGESVVSGKCNPDTFHILRSWDDKLEIVGKMLGEKQLITEMDDGGGVQNKASEMSRQAESCLSDKEILRLCDIGIQLEKYFGSGRDIEWAIVKDRIYILQCRPITTQDHESDEDLIHEFDSPLAFDEEWMTTGNIGEMMPKAVTPLTWSICRTAIDFSLQELFGVMGSKRNVSMLKDVPTCCNHLFLSMHAVDANCVTAAFQDKGIGELNLLGQKLPELTKEHLLEFYGEQRNTLKRLKSFIDLLMTMWNIPKLMEVWKMKMETYSVGEDCTTAKQLYEQISLKLSDYYEMFLTTMIVSTKSGSWPVVVMSVLSKGSDWTVEMYGDMAQLLSECKNVYSADVPMAIQGLAKGICEAGLEQDFLSSNDQECVEMLLRGNNRNLTEKTTLFLKKQGHRCIREAEFREKSWRADPAKLMKVLKAIIKTKSYNVKPKEMLTVPQLISRLETPVTAVGRLILRMILPKARSAVGEREMGKSMAIQMSDYFKQAYWRLADFMVQEGRLPEHDLIYFMTHYEIGRLLETRSPKIITRASRRRKIYPQQMSKKFSKTFKGHPEPLPEIDDAEFETVAELKGFPVSLGQAKGIARIVESLEEADCIQSGDILVVPITDVGWTPYFPLIAGLITETGGTISHGAVIAREYRIPCVVNVPRATNLIKSGELLLMDGRKGTIKKLNKTEERPE